MENIISYFAISSVFIVLFYFITMLKWNISWNLNKVKNKPAYKELSTFVTVILPVRNEEQNITNCLQNLITQNYPSGRLEIIVSDDFSTDRTVSLCNDFITKEQSAKHKIRLIQNGHNDATGKKAAIERAIKQSKAELILTTDADCVMGADWVNSFVYVFNKHHPDMITGFVRVAPAGNFFSALQAIEFLSLSGSSAMTVIRQKPLMCNGANLAFTKSAFMDSGGYSYGSDDASGDDTYLMLKISGRNRTKVVFNNFRDSIVTTTPEKSLQDLTSQRIRWASKVRNYKENYIKLTGLFVFIVNFILLISAAFSVAGLLSWKFTISVWVVKFIADLFVLYPAVSFAAQRNLLLLILPANILYPFYFAAGMLLSSVKAGYQWKERTY